MYSCWVFEVLESEVFRWGLLGRIMFSPGDVFLMMVFRGSDYVLADDVFPEVALRIRACVISGVWFPTGCCEAYASISMFPQ